MLFGWGQAVAVNYALRRPKHDMPGRRRPAANLVPALGTAVLEGYATAAAGDVFAPRSA